MKTFKNIFIIGLLLFQTNCFIQANIYNGNMEGNTKSADNGSSELFTQTPSEEFSSTNFTTTDTPPFKAPPPGGGTGIGEIVDADASIGEINSLLILLFATSYIIISRKKKIYK